MGNQSTWQERNSVSMIRLIADPMAFDQTKIQTSGFLVFAFEHCALYLSESDADIGLIENAIWVDPPAERLHDRRIGYCQVAGTFRANDHGHMGIYIAAMQDVVWIRPHNPQIWVNASDGVPGEDPNAYDLGKLVRAEQLEADNAAYRERFDQARELGQLFYQVLGPRDVQPTDQELVSIARDQFGKDDRFRELWLKERTSPPSGDDVSWLRQWLAP